jgi:hypothetical protein
MWPTTLFYPTFVAIVFDKKKKKNTLCMSHMSFSDLAIAPNFAPKKTLDDLLPRASSNLMDCNLKGSH